MKSIVCSLKLSLRNLNNIPMQSPVITLLQTNPRWGDAPGNHFLAEAMLTQAEKSDLYLLPEMFATGFATNPEGMAEAEPGETLHWMQRMAIQLDAAVAGSVAVRDAQGRARNRFYFITPAEQYFYDKTHLFHPAGEDRCYAPGEEHVEVEWRGVKYCLQVCFDLRFPESARNHAVAPYDVLLYVANWPAQRRLQWEHLLRARAIENQCYVAAVNRVGDDPVVHYDGSSCILDPLGEDLVRCPLEEESICSATLDMERLGRMRQHFPVLL